MNNCIFDTAMFYKLSNRNLAGMCASYVDDVFHIGNIDYAKLIGTKEAKFTCKERLWDKIQFFEVQINSHTPHFEIHQKKYSTKLEKLNQPLTFAEFRSLRAKLLWITNSRPDVFCVVALRAQVTGSRFEEKKEKEKVTETANNVATHLMKTLEFLLQFPLVDKKSLNIMSTQTLNMLQTWINFHSLETLCPLLKKVKVGNQLTGRPVSPMCALISFRK